MDLENNTKLWEYWNQCQIDFKLCESQLKELLKQHSIQKLKTSEILKEFIIEFNRTKFRESEIHHYKYGFGFGFDNISIGSDCVGTNLCLSIMRRIYPVDIFDLFELTLILEYDYPISLETYDNYQYSNISLEADEVTILEKLNFYKTYNILKDLVPLSFVIKSRYDA